MRQQSAPVLDRSPERCEVRRISLRLVLQLTLRADIERLLSGVRISIEPPHRHPSNPQGENVLEPAWWRVWPVKYSVRRSAEKLVPHRARVALLQLRPQTPQTLGVDLVLVDVDAI